MHPSLDFLSKFHPDGPWVLTAIPLHRKGTETRTFGPELTDQANRWIEEREGKQNLYFSINVPRTEVGKKTKREEIAFVLYLHVDVDPRAGEPLDDERKRILALLTTNRPDGVPEPTWIISSGGGYWGIWQLCEPIPIGGSLDAALDAARYNQQLEFVFGADTCHNIDRICRLPGTTNLPDEKKIKQGRVPAPAEVYSHIPENVYDLSQFVQAPSVHADTFTPPANVERLASVDDLDVPESVKITIVQGHDPDNPKVGDNTRSAWLFDVCCQLVRAEVPDEKIFAVITDPNFAISASVLDKDKPEEYAARQITRAHDATADFQRNEKGVPHVNQHNIRVALRKMDCALAHDVFARRLLLDGQHLEDEGVARLYLETERRFGFRPFKDYFWMVVEQTARANPVHPVREYLDGLNWDGQERLDAWLNRYANADDTPYVRAVGAIVLVAAVRRVRHPGCKFDEMLVLESSQGLNKSSALAVLAVKDEWFSDDLPLGADTKRQIEALAGRWIVEAAELKGMRKGEVEHLKSFLSRTVDRARMSYGRLVTEVPRHCIIVGTTNSERYLRDNTGNRRYWPVRVGEFDLRALRRDRDQLWAEATERERDPHFSIRLAEGMWQAAWDEQEQRRVEDPFVEQLRAVLGDRNGKLRAVDAWQVVGVPPGQRTQEHNARLGEALRELGWERTKRRFDGGPPEWCYVRGTGNERDVPIEPDGVL